MSDSYKGEKDISMGFKDKFVAVFKKVWPKFVKVIKRIWVWLVMAAVVLAVILGVTFYTSGIRKTLYNNSIENMLEVTAQGGDSLSNYIEKDLAAAERLADRLSALDADSREGINAVLDVISAQTTTYTVTVVKPAAGKEATKGDVYTNDKKTVDKADDASLAKLENSFKNVGIDLSEDIAAGSSAVHTVRGVFEPEGSGVKQIAYYQAFQFAKGSVAVLQEYRDVSDVVARFTLSFYDGAGTSHIINNTGKTVISRDQTYDNLFDKIKEGNSEKDFNDFIAEVEKEGKCAKIFSLDGKDNAVAIDRLKMTNGWYMVSVVPVSTIMSDAENIISTSAIFGVVIAFAVVVTVLLVFLMQRNRRVLVEKDAEIQYREQLFDILANNTDEVFLMVAKKGLAVEYVSPNVERVLGISTREVKKSLNNLGKAKYPRGEVVNYRTLETMQLGSSISYETERLHKLTGERRYFTETIYHVQSEQSEKFILAISDRTEELFSKQSLEEALNIAKVANKAKSAFLANMSHDIRTPMNAIVGLCTLLERDAEDKDKVREHVRQITLSSRHMLEILNDILDMSKIESGETELNISEINLSDLVKEIENIIRPQTKAKDQSFNIVVAVQEGVFLGDKLRIKRIMMNILSNAVKYTPEGGRIDFTIRQMARASKKYVRIQFIIKDNGVGMSPDYQKKIFEPFTRETSSILNSAHGTGLGMPIAKNLVDLMGGTIAVDSREGEGTTFTVNIKFQLSEEEDGIDFWAEHGIERMLVIGCNAEDKASISDAMSKTDVTVTFTDGGKTAVNNVLKAQKEGKHYDAVLCDWQSTEDDRIPLIEGLRNALPVNVPIIAFGEHDWSDNESKVIESGAIIGFLVKPFFLTALMDCIAGKKVSKKTSLKSGRAAIKGMHFLAAEDNELNCMILTELLSTVGAECVIKRDGKEALEAFENSVEGCFDAILMDVQMPIMNGYEATRAIRACEHPSAKTIPIIAMTANAFADDIQKSLDAGMTAHLSKPIDLAALEKIIEGIKSENKNN